MKTLHVLLPAEENCKIPAFSAAAMFYDVGYQDTMSDSGMAEYTFDKDIAKLHYSWGTNPTKRSGTILYRWYEIDDEYRRGIGLFRFSMNMGAGGCAGSACGASGTRIEGILKNYVINGIFYEVRAEAY